VSPARFIANFDRIVDAPGAIPSLRGFVLDLAVRGKLAPQDPTEEPASELLHRIRAEKEALRRNGSSRLRSAAPLLEVAAPPFPLPESWMWVSLADVLTKLTDGTHHSPPNGESGDFMYVTAKNVKPEGVSLHNISYVSADVHREIYARCDPECGDILYVKDGATTGIVTINNLTEPFSMLSSVALLKLADGVYNRLLVQFLRSPFFYQQMRGLMKGAAITRVTLKRMAPALLPLPPEAEQRRIVENIEEFSRVLDQIEKEQAATLRQKELLLDVLIHEALGVEP
jgi:type I restriction enzyme S subunit